MIAPFAIAFVGYQYFKNSKRLWLFYAIELLVIFLKLLNGYEYVSTIAISVLVPIVFFELVDKKTKIINLCVGFIVRDISETTHMSSLSDEEKSASLAGTRLSNVDSFTETSREKVSLVRDDGGTMEGYNITYTGTYAWADGTTAVTGYRFARAVGAEIGRAHV